MRNIILLASLCLVSTASLADQLIVTGEKSSKSAIVGLDYSSDGKASGLQFRINLPEVKAGKIDYSRALSGLPKSHQGQCHQAGNVLSCMIYSDQNAVLPRGVISIGTLSLPAGSSQATVSDFEAVDSMGVKVSASVQLETDVVKNSEK